MAKIRKILGKSDSPYIVSLMKLIETQSKETIAKWCIDYSEEFILPIYQVAYPNDDRVRSALNAAHNWLLGEITLKEVKKYISDVQVAAREAKENPAAQAAARAIGQASASIYNPAGSLAIAFYGAAAIAYNRVGVNEKPEIYEQIATEECDKMEISLGKVAIENEVNPAKINWNC
ncbi:MAG: hypothetical protein RR891_09240 [Clostridium sp.]|uniref:putative immunity protein n=1 Tax=Clostridium sp. TaxID=1506 RepID=UPI003041E7FB